VVLCKGLWHTDCASKYTITRKHAGSFAEECKVDIKAPCQALLPTLAFEGSTKRNRPMLKVGDVVFCRVTSASAYMDPELSCMNGKGLADGLGQMQGGYMFDTTTQHCRKLLQNPPPLELQLIRDAVVCELAVGVNGRVWVKSKELKKTAALVRVLQACARTTDASQIQSTIGKELNVVVSKGDAKGIS
jgi:exosome complex component RRP40